MGSAVDLNSGPDVSKANILPLSYVTQIIFEFLPNVLYLRMAGYLPKCWNAWNMKCLHPKQSSCPHSRYFYLRPSREIYFLKLKYDRTGELAFWDRFQNNSTLENSEDFCHVQGMHCRASHLVAARCSAAKGPLVTEPKAVLSHAFVFGFEPVASVPCFTLCPPNCPFPGSQCVGLGPSPSLQMGTGVWQGDPEPFTLDRLVW